MATQTTAAVKIGNTRTLEVADITDPGCRTQNQLEAVIALHKRVPSAWWTNNPFKREFPDQKFKCSFRHLFFDTKGSLRSAWITPTGRVTITAPLPENKGFFKDETDAVLAIYGPFRG